MEWAQTVVLGVVEGITEFLPVSSTAHLMILGRYINQDPDLAATFNMAIQLGAILAVVKHEADVFKRLVKPSYWRSKEAMAVMIAAIPVMAVAFVAYDTIKHALFSPVVVSMGLVAGSVAMLGVDRAIKRGWLSGHVSSLDRISWRQALMVGVCQCCALWPGFSRSASTIMGGLLGGLRYPCAARFSFVVAVPVLAAAVGYDMLNSAGSLAGHDWVMIALGTVVSGLVAWVSIAGLMAILLRFGLVPFAYYRLMVAGLVWWFAR